MFIVMLFAVGLAAASVAEELTVQLQTIDSTGVGKSIGTVRISQTPYGALLTPDLSGLTPGLHGFHVHEHPACDPAEKAGKMTAGEAAGGHYDPAGTGRHEGPYGNGHLGDLPPLYVDAEGKATLPVLAPRLKLADLKGRVLMVHEGGDNYSDTPKPLGGGGGRVACGLVQ
jgi:Cu-Zn family superoxide dismutase